jgi:predicted phosphoribosyltransferase
MTRRREPTMLRPCAPPNKSHDFSDLLGQDRASVSSAPFADRRAAGVELAARLAHYGRRTDVLVLALPRGGVPVGHELAKALDAPLDVLLVRKLGVPGQRELAMGAIASGGVRVLNDDIVRWYDIPDSVIDAVAVEEQAEIERQEHAFRGEKPPLEIHNRVVILVDDGLATGSTLRAAVQAVRRLAPARVVVAVPVGAPESCREMGKVADEVVCARTPEHFTAVGMWYKDFSQTTDQEVAALLHDRATLPRH